MIEIEVPLCETCRNRHWPGAFCIWTAAPPPVVAGAIQMTAGPVLGSFQARVGAWMLACFGETVTADALERAFRFGEEALELVQAQGATREEAHRLVDYVYDRPIGDPRQEIGGVLVTLAALCGAGGYDMAEAGEAELARVWTKIDKIRAKHNAKPQGVRSALPGVVEG